jgi:hypothetical protein
MSETAAAQDSGGGGCGGNLDPFPGSRFTGGFGGGQGIGEGGNFGIGGGGGAGSGVGGGSGGFRDGGSC